MSSIQSDSKDRVEEADEKVHRQRAAALAPRPRGRGDDQAAPSGRDERRGRPVRHARRSSRESDLDLGSRRDRERVDEESE
jgi:hypothetical protein